MNSEYMCAHSATVIVARVSLCYSRPGQGAESMYISIMGVIK